MRGEWTRLIVASAPRESGYPKSLGDDDAKATPPSVPEAGIALRANAGLLSSRLALEASGVSEHGGKVVDAVPPYRGLAL